MGVKKCPFNDDKLRNYQGLLQFINCKLLRGHKLVDEDLWVENGVVVNPEPIFFQQKRLPVTQIDCGNCILAPGFIDIQINGGFGIDFSSDPEQINSNVQKVAQDLTQFGVTSFCPTVVTSSPNFYKIAVGQLKKCPGGKSGASVLGLHLEGPFISKEKKGAHPLKHFVDGFSNGFTDLEDIYGENLQSVSLITLAPELPNSISVIRQLVFKGIKVSLGHSAASLTIGEEAVQAGASCITHLFNAMLPFHHRDPGLVGLLTSANIPKDRVLYFGVIADGIHTHDAALRIAHRTHPEGLILVTDAVAPFGLSEGTHHLGDTKVEVKKHKALVAGTETLVGSISSMDHCVRHFVKAARCTIMEGLECASLHPAKCLGIEDRKGSLDYGRDADFVILNDDLRVKATFIGGQLVWSS